MFDGDKLVAKVPLSWKKSLTMGVVNPHEIRICIRCTEDIFCHACDKLKNQNKKFQQT